MATILEFYRLKMAAQNFDWPSKYQLVWRLNCVSKKNSKNIKLIQIKNGAQDDGQNGGPKLWLAVTQPFIIRFG